jgi:hypothetical protein
MPLIHGLLACHLLEFARPAHTHARAMHDMKLCAMRQIRCVISNTATKPLIRQDTGQTSVNSHSKGMRNRHLSLILGTCAIIVSLQIH